MKKPSTSGLGVLATPNFIYGLIIIFFVFYFISRIWLFGLLVGASIIWMVVLEFWLGAKQHGWKDELKETAAALLLALFIWFGAGFVLQTPSPLNAIVSCSMLPHLQRGDMIILSGDRLDAPAEEIGALEGIGDAKVYRGNVQLLSVKGSLYAYCAARRGNAICNEFVTSQSEFAEKHGELTIGYEKCASLYPASGRVENGPCVAWLEVNGRRYYENLSNDVVVYAPEKDEYYSRVGDIIHRAFIKLKTPNGTYFLTKGDNNPIFDIQVYDEQSGMGNRPVEISRSKGRVLLQVPIIGYFKLFISPQAILTPEGCDRYFAKYAR